jgi:hypothetical protein
MPLRWGSYNGIEAPTARIFEDFLDLSDLNKSSYEKGMISALENYAEPGDELTIIGGGLGITAVKASEILNPEDITIYEGSADYHNRILKTLDYHDLSEIKVINSIVETDENLFGQKGGSQKISASEIEECDVLEIDVEGAEIPILENLEIRPRVIIVESHGVFDSPTKEVKEVVEDLGYGIVDVREAEKDEKIQEQDVKIIIGKYE